MPEKSIRFGVTDHAGRRSSTWKCWTQVGLEKKDVYISCRELRGKLKLSLHETGRWHVAFDWNQFPSMFRDSPPDTRFLSTWDKPASIIQGLTLACRIHFPWHVATIPDALDAKVIWIPVAPQGQSVEVAVFLSEGEMVATDWPARVSMSTRPVGSFELDGGGCVWIVYRTCPSIEQKLPPASDPRYFRNAGEADLFMEGTRAVMWGAHEDGSVIFQESPVTVTKNS